MSDADQVSYFVENRITQLGRSSSQRTATLAKLRRCVGKPPGASPEAWELTLADLPESLTGYDGEPSYAEWSIHLAMTLYALHQQGKADSVNIKGVTFGQAVRRLVAPDRSNENGIKRRFDAVLTAKGISEFAHHARGLVQLMKAKDIPLDYSRFARDVFLYQFSDSQDKVRLRWGEDYYKVNLSQNPATENESVTDKEEE